jgi:hypothetical protein
MSHLPTVESSRPATAGALSLARGTRASIRASFTSPTSTVGVGENVWPQVAAAELRSICRRAVVQLGTIDALLAQFCIRPKLTLLTVVNDSVHAARYCKLEVWE